MNQTNYLKILLYNYANKKTKIGRICAENATYIIIECISSYNKAKSQSSITISVEIECTQFSMRKQTNKHSES